MYVDVADVVNLKLFFFNLKETQVINLKDLFIFVSYIKTNN